MTKLIAILFLTLVGTIAQATTPLEFALTHCRYADDPGLCDEELQKDAEAEKQSKFTLTLKVCSETNISYAPRRSTCFVKAAEILKDDDFTQVVLDCRTVEGGWFSSDRDARWSERTSCQAKAFEDRAQSYEKHLARSSKDRSSRDSRVRH